MSETAMLSGQQIHKRYVETTVFFAINNVPQVDEATLEKFLELINATGNFGSISDKQLLQKMWILKKHVPETCEYSLLTLAELLGICPPMTTDNLNILVEETNC
jgi:hypothetical protein